MSNTKWRIHVTGICATALDVPRPITGNNRFSNFNLIKLFKKRVPHKFPFGCTYAKLAWISSFILSNIFKADIFREKNFPQSKFYTQKRKCKVIDN